MFKKMNDNKRDEDAVMEYVRKHPYSSVRDVADALGWPQKKANRVLTAMHNEWRVYLVRGRFDSKSRRTIPYESPLVEIETWYPQV
jgi:hypothetical protein